MIRWVSKYRSWVRNLKTQTLNPQSQYGLELLSPVDDGGKFTEEAGEALVGKDVLGDGNQAVIDMMR